MHTLLGGVLALDLPTLLLSCGLVVTICGSIFILSTVLEHNDVPSRLWSAAFTFGILAMVSFAVWAAIPDSTAIVGVGNGALTLAMGLIWSGNRAYNGRSPLYVASTAGGVVVAIVAWIDAAAGSWAGGQVFLIGVCVYALLSGVEAATGRMRRSVNARILASVMLIVGLFYAIRAVVFAVSGPFSDAFLDFLDSDITTFVTILFVITASTSMSVLRTEGMNARSPRTLDVGRWGKFASPESFAIAADDRLERLERRGEVGVLIRIDIDNLSEMNTAFGRVFSDAAMTLLGSILRDEVPSSALLGYNGGAGFEALVFEGLDNALDRAQRIRSALVDTPVDTSQGLRVSVTIALVVPETGELSFASLSERAARFIDKGQSAGGNVIVGHPEEFSRV